MVSKRGSVLRKFFLVFVVFVFLGNGALAACTDNDGGRDIWVGGAADGDGGYKKDFCGNLGTNHYAQTEAYCQSGQTIFSSKGMRCYSCITSSAGGYCGSPSSSVACFTEGGKNYCRITSAAVWSDDDKSPRMIFFKNGNDACGSWSKSCVDVERDTGAYYGTCSNNFLAGIFTDLYILADCGCQSSTAIGTRMCDGNIVKEWRDTDSNGCGDTWVTITTCSGATPLCSGGACVACSDTCPNPSTVNCGVLPPPLCSGGACEQGTYCASGTCQSGVCCGAIGQPCCSGNQCSSGTCVGGTCSGGGCTPDCSPLGARICIQEYPGQYRTCQLAGDGCNHWSEVLSCGGDSMCVGSGECIECGCTEGETRCNPLTPNQVQTCVLVSGTSCYAWMVTENCGDEGCSDGVCGGGGQPEEVCEISKVRWEANGKTLGQYILENKEIQAVVEGDAECVESVVLDRLEIYDSEEDLIDSASSSEREFGDDNLVKFDWTTILDGENSVVYYFETELNGDSFGGIDETNITVVKECRFYESDGESYSILSCDDYNKNIVGERDNKESCLADCADVVVRRLESGPNGETGSCKWGNVNGVNKCFFSYTPSQYEDADFYCRTENLESSECGEGDAVRTISVKNLLVNITTGEVREDFACYGSCGASICAITVPCPSVIELPFFTLSNLIAAVIVIIFVYLFLRYKKNQGEL